MKLTMLGAGVRAPFVLRGLALGEPPLPLAEVVLYDRDPERLEIMSALGASLAATWGATFSVRGEPDPDAAVAGARFVFAAIRPGQEAARTIDEEVPLRLGLLGQETTGPGGFAMALRTIPAMLGYARAIERVAPDALVVDFTNPVGIVMQALSDHTSVRAVGICDGPIAMHRSIARFLGRPRTDVQVGYFGLNHCGWIHRVLVDGVDRLPEVIDRFEELQAFDEQWAVFDPAFVRTTAMLPMEYVYFYASRHDAIEHIRRSGGSRGRQVEAINASLWPALREAIHGGDLATARATWERAMAERHGTYFARERGASVEALGQDRPSTDVFEGEGYEGVANAVMAAEVRRTSVPLILNTVNGAAIDGLREDDVVEVSCIADGDGAHPIAQGSMPEREFELIDALKRYERLTVKAAVEGSYDAALSALTVHPLVDTARDARAVLDAYIDALGDLLPTLA
jgi:6-phospho-beta-glucosidase